MTIQARTSKFWLMGVSCATLTLAMAAAPAQAQTSPTSAEAAPTEVIIVTARRIEENLQEVPLTIRVLSEAAIEREGVRTLNDVARRIEALL